MSLTSLSGLGLIVLLTLPVMTGPLPPPSRLRKPRRGMSRRLRAVLRRRRTRGRTMLPLLPLRLLRPAQSLPAVGRYSRTLVSMTRTLLTVTGTGISVLWTLLTVTVAIVLLRSLAARLALSGIGTPIGARLSSVRTSVMRVSFPNSLDLLDVHMMNN